MYIYLISRELPLRKQVIHAQRSFSYFRPVEAQASHGAENTKTVLFVKKKSSRYTYLGRQAHVSYRAILTTVYLKSMDILKVSQAVQWSTASCPTQVGQIFS